MDSQLGGVGGYYGLPNEGHAIAVDDLDNVYVSGIYRGKCEFNPDGGYVYESQIGSDGYYGDDVFLSKFDSSGAFQWATAFGGVVYDNSRGVAAYGDSNVFITGYFSGKIHPVDLDPGPGEYIITSNGGSDVFLVNYVP